MADCIDGGWNSYQNSTIAAEGVSFYIVYNVANQYRFKRKLLETDFWLFHYTNIATNSYKNLIAQHKTRLNETKKKVDNDGWYVHFTSLI
jgi:hypothetical protein